MSTIAITNQKGGSGKTTTAVNLSAALAAAGKKTLLIDLDAQASASAWCGVFPEGKGIFSLFVEGALIDEIIAPTGFPLMSVAPATSWLVGAEKALAAEVGAETILDRALKPINESYDYIIIDCPPSLGVLTINALCAATEVIVPVESHVMALAGLAQLTQTIEVVRERLNPALHISGIVACRFDMRTRHAQEVFEILRERFGDQVYPFAIRENVRLAEAPSFGKPINAYSPKSPGAQDYQKMADEVIKRSE